MGADENGYVGVFDTKMNLLFGPIEGYAKAYADERMILNEDLVYDTDGNVAYLDGHAGKVADLGGIVLGQHGKHRKGGFDLLEILVGTQIHIRRVAHLVDEPGGKTAGLFGMSDGNHFFGIT